jgi:putative endonuclease
MGGEENRDGRRAGAYAVGHMRSSVLKPMGAAAPLGTRLERRWLDAQQWALGGIDWLAGRLRGGNEGSAAHLASGVRGEGEALFHLRRQGYTIVARRWTNPKVRGDVDLIGWEGEWLCFIEVKARTGRDRVPAEFAVDGAKQETLRRLARAYLKGIAEERRRGIPVRFDVVSVYFVPGGARRGVEVEVLRGAFPRSLAQRRGGADF